MLIANKNSELIGLKFMYFIEFITCPVFKIINDEHFWMYKGFELKERALEVALILSEFYPYSPYVTNVIVVEYEIIEEELKNRNQIMSYTLVNEDGKIGL